MNIQRESLRYGGKTIAYRVRRSARRKKTMQISVDGEGAIVAAPVAVPDAEIRAFVRRKADWILKSLAQMKASAKPPPTAGVRRESLRYGDKTIPYRVRRSARRKKTIQISIDAEGVIVAAPVAVPDAEIQAFVRKKADWILESLAHMKAVAESSRFVNGNSLPYRGMPVRLDIRFADAGEVRFSMDESDGSIIIEFDEDAVRVDFDDRDGERRFRIAVPKIFKPAEREKVIGRELSAWYWRQAETLIAESVERWLPKFGVKRKPTVIVRDQKRRWGSCSSDGVLRFNWRLAMLHPDLLDYVVVHELSHLAVMNHSPKFWAEVEKRLPDVRELRRRIKEDGRALPPL